MTIQSTQGAATTDFELESLLSQRPSSSSEQDATQPSLSRSDAGIDRRGQLDHDRTINLPETLSRVWRAIMSSNPLLGQSTPAYGTNAIGDVPITSANSPAYDNENDCQQAYEERDITKTQSSGYGPHDRGRFTDSRREHHPTHRRRRRSSSFASEITLGPALTTFGTPHPIQENAVGSSAASLRTQEEHDERDHSTEDPPDNSQYPEVRASVQATDNIALSIDTPRMWTLSLLFAVAGSATNLFFSLRYPAVAITPVIALVLVHPIGKTWDFMLKRRDDPDQTFIDGERTGDAFQNETTPLRTRFRLWLAQGRWNEKEHACVYISSNVSFGFAFATDVIVEQHKFYKQDVTIIYQLLLTISTQILGYAFAGLTRRYLVRPASMIWPGTLMSTAMFTTMHKNENKVANGWSISRYRFFLYVWAGAFAWYFLPGLLMPALSYFNVVTWFAPRDVVTANLVSSGILASNFR